MKELKEEVRNILMDNSMDILNKTKLIDEVERLGLHYFYDNEINELLSRIFQELSRNDFDVMNDYDLHNVASQFRLFREHGYKMPSGNVHFF